METGNETKVISLKDRANKGASAAPEQMIPNAPAPADFDWGSIMKRNSENGSRQMTDREKANKGVIRSHRLKN
ncbi:MAG: hypothetical protein H7249_14285 [Chitinophagaceae bacterium]|nr:hypothetical protein [Oligoflexus sp.]